MNKRGISNRIGHVVIVVLILAIAYVWIAFNWENSRPERLGCFESFYVVSINPNETCIQEDGNLMLYATVNDVSGEGWTSSNFAGLQLYSKPTKELSDTTGPNGELMNRTVRHEIVFLDSSDYDFKTPVAERGILIEGAYSNLTHLEVAPAIEGINHLGDLWRKTCDSMSIIAEVRRCNG